MQFYYPQFSLSGQNLTVGSNGILVFNLKEVLGVLEKLFAIA
jgi:hypothetical protein